MEEFLFEDGVCYEWQDGKTRSSRGNRCKKEDTETADRQKDLIRALQSVFCTGRYRSWISEQAGR
jgi:hypothetical protein